MFYLIYGIISINALANQPLSRTRLLKVGMARKTGYLIIIDSSLFAANIYINQLSFFGVLGGLVGVSASTRKTTDEQEGTIRHAKFLRPKVFLANSQTV